MNTESDAGMIADQRVVEFDASIQETIRIVSSLSVAFANFRIEQRRVLRSVDLDVGAAEFDQLLHLAAENVDHISKISVDCRIRSLRLVAVVVSRSLLGAEERDFRSAFCAGAEIGKLFRAHVPLALEI